MYKFFSEIRLWCEAKGKESHSKLSNEEEPKPKREKHKDVETEIRAQLEEKHSTKYTGPQYNLWTNFIRNGHHESYDEPSPIPLITGEQRGRAQPKKSISDAIVGAATAFAHAPTSTETPSVRSTPTSAPVLKTGLSPNNQANLRRKYLEDLHILSQLLNDGVLSDAEFQEQKDTLLNGLRKLK